MKLLGEAMRTAPDTAQQETLDAVLDVAEAWERGDIDVAGVRSSCTGHDRVVAMRVAALGSADKRLLVALADVLVGAEKESFDSEHGVVGMSEVYDGAAKAMTNHEGRRVFVWPMFMMDGVAAYPRVDLPPGEKRRGVEEAALVGYREYRKQKRGDRGEGGWRR